MPGTFAYTVATNTVVVTGGTSGSPADFASFVTADRAGTGTSLKAATAASKTLTLTYAVRPVELRAIVVKCIVASKARGPIATVSINAAGLGYTALDVLTITQTGSAGGQVTVATVDGSGAVTGVTVSAAGTGYLVANGLATTGGTGTGCKINVLTVTNDTDYIFITGTDAWDAAQTENIDVSAGNGSYTSTKRWRTISNISCSDAVDGTGTVWADGTLAVTQDIWGVIWNLGSSQYRIDALIEIGDTSTSTVFQTKIESSVFTISNPRATPNGTLTIGEPSNTSYSKSSCYMKVVGQSATHQLQSGGTLNIYGSLIEWSGAQLWFGGGGTFNVYDSIFNGNGQGLAESTTACISHSWRDVYITNVYSLTILTTPTVFNNVRIENATTQGLNNFGGVTVNTTGLLVTNSNPDVRTNSSGTVTNLINPLFYVTNPLIAFSDNIIREQYRCDINICDKSGVAISGAVVDCEDTTATAAWGAGTVTTNASGNITQQTITYKSWTTTSETLTTYSPHKFTISKTGYETLVLNAITVSAPIKWHLELQDYQGGAKAIQVGIGVI